MTRTKEQVKAEIARVTKRIEQRDSDSAFPHDLYGQRQRLRAPLAQLERNDNDRAG